MVEVEAEVVEVRVQREARLAIDEISLPFGLVSFGSMQSSICRGLLLAELLDQLALLDH